jgi:type VI secretion system protein ImpL
VRTLFSLPGRVIIWLMRHPGYLVTIGFMFIIGLVWVGGPYVGMESAQSRATVMVGAALSRIVAWLVDHLRDKARATELERSLVRQGEAQIAQARPDRKEQMAAIRDQFDKAINTLKQSKLAEGRKGTAALYALPWYMFIGPPASGKSTALRHSGLRFPYLGESGKGLQGVGGTRNCDWWFTNEAVLLDTAGRYVTEDEDQEEWYSFLELLKKYRKEKPINGVIVAISVAELVQAKDEDVDSHAKKIRGRIDELIKRLGITFPVYLVFTKSDLIQGFVEFFEDLSRAEREQIWGATFRKAPEEKEAPHQRFDEEFQQLLESLQARRLRRLETSRGTQKVPIYAFPLQFASVRAKCGRFIEVLFQTNTFQENPVFRGFYFTSGTQEGTPIDRIMGAVCHAAGLPSGATGSFAPKETKSYFIKNLFTDVIFPDHILAGASSAAFRQQGALRVAAFTVAVVLVAALLTGFAVSFIGNRAVVSGALSAAVRASKVGLEGDHFEQDVEYLDKVGARLADLYRYETKGVPTRLWGFYRGHRVFPPLRDIYLSYFQQAILIPTKQEIEHHLAYFVRSADDELEGSDQYYTMLKAYLMLSDETRLNQAFLQHWLSETWKEWLAVRYQERGVPEDLENAVLRQIALYSQHVAGGGGAQFAPDKALVYRTQQKLRQIPTTQRLYDLIRRAAAEKKKDPFTIQTVLHGSQQGLLVSEYGVPHLFTYEGWRTIFNPSLERLLQEMGEEGWVTGINEVKRGDLAEGVHRLYFAEYVQHWQAFLESVKVRPSATPADAEELLANLSHQDSAFRQLLVEVVRNTVPDNEIVTRTEAVTGGIVQRVKQTLGFVPERADEALAQLRDKLPSRSFLTTVSPQFRSMHDFVVVQGNGKEKEKAAESAFDLYLAELRRVHQVLRPILRSDAAAPDTKAMSASIVSGAPSDLVQAVKTTETLLQRLSPDLRERIQGVMLQPLLVVMHGVMQRAKGEVARRWEAEVYQPCQRSIAGKYPFRVDGEEAALTDVADFFHPQNGTLWKFYQAEIKPYVEEGAERWEPRRWKGVGMEFSEDFLDGLQYARYLSEGLFTKGNADLGVAFDLYPYPPVGPGGRTVSEISLEIGGDRLRYRMEPQEPYGMKWPGQAGANGAVLQVQMNGSWQNKDKKGWWGFFRLLDAGQVAELSDTQFRVQWEVAGPDLRSVVVQYDLTAPSYKNPFHPGFFTRFACMQQL